LRRELALTLLVAEADVRWLARIADAALVMDRGQIIARYEAVAGHVDTIQRILTGEGAGQAA
jgi:ABC-type dipeptide/oligopeptide/nickel transport system ATPase subunit